MNTKLKVLAAAIAITSMAAQAELNMTGPVSAATGNFPTYYQDLSGLTLDLCLPSRGVELDQGLCLLLPADIPSPTQAISFPNNFPEEAFWWNGGSTLTLGDGSSAVLVMGLEAAFANGGPVPGDQIVFARIRVKFFAPADGHYTVTHPYGVEEFDAKAGEKIFFTEDQGAFCGTDFTCATKGRFGPFLRPSAIPGGAPLDPVVIDGKTYIADPAVATVVTGGLPGHNVFRIEGPDIGGLGINMIENTLFNLMGKVHTGPLDANVNIERATYTRSAGKAHIDLYVNAETGLGQAVPQLKAFGNNIPGVSLVQSANNPRLFYGKIALPTEDKPNGIILSDLRESPNRFFSAKLVDVVSVTKAKFDGASLHVEAESSDKSTQGVGSRPILTVYGSDGALVGEMNLVGDTYVLDAVSTTVPSKKVVVKSDKGGWGELAIETVADVESTSSLKTHDDSANASVPMDVLANDSVNDVVPALPADVRVHVITEPSLMPQHGSIVINADQTVTYTQNDAVNGSDSFSYYLTDVAGVNISNISKVSFNISDGNLPPVATPDVASAGMNATIMIDVLANDSDPEGTALTLDTVIGVGATKVGNKISFVAPGVEGVQTVQYTVRDVGGMTATGTVTITVVQPETVAISLAEYRTGKSQWRVSGTDFPAKLGVKMTIYANNVQIGTTSTDALGVWDYRNTTNVVPVNGTPIKVVSERGAQFTTSLVVRK